MGQIKWQYKYISTMKKYDTATIRRNVGAGFIRQQKRRSSLIPLVLLRCSSSLLYVDCVWCSAIRVCVWCFMYDGLRMTFYVDFDYCFCDTWKLCPQNKASNQSHHTAKPDGHGVLLTHFRGRSADILSVERDSDTGTMYRYTMYKTDKHKDAGSL